MTLTLDDGTTIKLPDGTPFRVIPGNATMRQMNQRVPVVRVATSQVTPPVISQETQSVRSN